MMRPTVSPIGKALTSPCSLACELKREAAMAYAVSAAAARGGVDHHTLDVGRAIAGARTALLQGEVGGITMGQSAMEGL